MTLRNYFFEKKLKLPLKEIQFIKLLKIWWRMAAMFDQIFNDFILSAMLLHQ